MAVYKDEQKKTWYCKFRFTDWQGRNQSTTKRGFATKREALAYEHEYKQKAKSQPGLTVQQLFEAYTQNQKLHYKQSTVISNAASISKHVLPFFGSRKVRDIRPADLQAWQASLAKTSLAPGTIRAMNKRFSAMLNFAVKFYGLPSNPFAIAGKTGRLEKRSAFWEEQEFKQVVDQMDSEPDKIYFRLLFYSGMRHGELLALTPADFDFANNRISITKSYDYRLHITTTPKTKSSTRRIAMPPKLMAEVKAYFDKFPVLPEAPFQIVSAKRMYARLKKAASKAGIQPINIHGLRHSHASYLIKAQVPITAISKRLGHANPSITLSHYSHMYKDDDSDIAALLDKTL